MYYDYNYETHECEEKPETHDFGDLGKKVLNTAFNLMKMSVGALMVFTGYRIINDARAKINNQ